MGKVMLISAFLAVSLMAGISTAQNKITKRESRNILQSNKNHQKYVLVPLDEYDELIMSYAKNLLFAKKTKKEYENIIEQAQSMIKQPQMAQNPKESFQVSMNQQLSSNDKNAINYAKNTLMRKKAKKEFEKSTEQDKTTIKNQHPQITIHPQNGISQMIASTQMQPNKKANDAIKLQTPNIRPDAGNDHSFYGSRPPVEMFDATDCAVFQPRGGAVMLPHPERQNKFLMCISRNKAVVMNCAQGTLFDLSAKECNRIDRGLSPYGIGFKRYPRLQPNLQNTARHAGHF